MPWGRVALLDGGPAFADRPLKTKAFEKGLNSMGSNPTEAAGIFLFLTGFTALAAGFAQGGVLYYLVAVVLVAGSLVLFRKCKHLEVAQG
jgi:hypothetical protein